MDFNYTWMLLLTSNSCRRWASFGRKKERRNWQSHWDWCWGEEGFWDLKGVFWDLKEVFWDLKGVFWDLRGSATTCEISFERLWQVSTLFLLMTWDSFLMVARRTKDWSWRELGNYFWNYNKLGNFKKIDSEVKYRNSSFNFKAWTLKNCQKLLSFVVQHLFDVFC